MTAKPFTGHIRAMRADTDYFGAEDFVDSGDIPLQIDAVMFDDALKVGAGKAKPTYFLTLKNQVGKPCHKRMLLNAGRRKMLAALYGGVAEKWVGKWVWVYVDRVKNPAGGTDVLGMKFRDRSDAPKQREPATAEPAPAPVKETLEQVFDRYLEVLQRAKNPQAVGTAYDTFWGPESPHKWTNENVAEGLAAKGARLDEILEGAK